MLEAFGVDLTGESRQIFERNEIDMEATDDSEHSSEKMARYVVDYRCCISPWIWSRIKGKKDVRDPKE